VLVHKLGAVIDLVVNDHEQVLLGVVLGNVLVGVLLVGHFAIVGFFFFANNRGIRKREKGRVSLNLEVARQQMLNVKEFQVKMNVAKEQQRDRCMLTAGEKKN
jgi:hypothetical protein